MKWFVLIAVLIALAACSTPAERRVVDSPLAREGGETPGEDRTFGYLSDEFNDHVEECELAWSKVFDAFGRGVARDWERIEKTLR